MAPVAAVIPLKLAPSFGHLSRWKIDLFGKFESLKVREVLIWIFTFSITILLVVIVPQVVVANLLNSFLLDNLRE